MDIPETIVEDSSELDKVWSIDLFVAKKLVWLEQRASTKKIEFGVTFNKLKKLLTQKKCYYTGIVFEKTTKVNGILINSRSIDRIDSSVGYIDSNIIACTLGINQKKKDLSSKEIEQLYKGLVKLKQIKK